jgi:hypothetical protein
MLRDVAEGKLVDPQGGRRSGYDGPMMRPLRLLVMAASLLLLAACASSPEEPVASSDSEECMGVAQEASGYRGTPKRSRARGQPRTQDPRLEAFQAEYERCMRARGHETSDPAGQTTTPAP